MVNRAPVGTARIRIVKYNKFIVVQRISKIMLRHGVKYSGKMYLNPDGLRFLTNPFISSSLRLNYIALTLSQKRKIGNQVRNLIEGGTISL